MNRQSIETPSVAGIRPLLAKLRTKSSQLGRCATSERTSVAAASTAPVGQQRPGPGEAEVLVTGEHLECTVNRRQGRCGIAADELLLGTLARCVGVRRVEQRGEVAR